MGNYTNRSARRVTNKLLELIDDGTVHIDDAINACLGAMSEADVAEMCERNGFLTECEDCDTLIMDEESDGVCDTCRAARDEADNDNDFENGDNLDDTTAMVAYINKFYK